jgi:hypothetical protein
MKDDRTRHVVRSALAASLVLCIPGLSARDKPKHEPPRLPAQILRAKTVCFATDLYMQDTPHRVRERLERWGRFRLEDDDKKADLILVIEGWGDQGARLTIFDTAYRHALWAIMTDGGLIPDRCVRLIEIFRQQIKAEEARQKQTSSSPQQP